MKSIKVFIAVLALLGIFGCQEKKEAADQKAKYIFYFIGDGMGHSIISVTESYLSYKAGKLGGEQLTMTTFPVTGDVTTYSDNSIVTCSAAAGTALACGVKTTNGFLGRTPDGVPAKSIAFDLKEEGYKVGIMSSVPINHATPAAFFATPENRNKYYEITQAIPESGFEFFASTGFIGFYPADETLPDSEALLESKG